MKKKINNKFHVHDFRACYGDALRELVLFKFEHLHFFLKDKSEINIEYTSVMFMYAKVIRDRLLAIISDENLKADIKAMYRDLNINEGNFDSDYQSERRAEFLYELNQILHLWNGKYSVLKIAGLYK
jgi:hypothetical protein